MLNLSTVGAAVSSASDALNSNTNNRTSDNENNDSDSDFDFLNKTDNQISDDDEDSDINTQFKQNLINQQILQQQQLYLQQQQQHQQQQQQHQHQQHIQLNENALKTQNPRKKLTKKKSSRVKLLGSRTSTIGIKENVLKENENFNNPVNSEDEYENSRPASMGQNRGLFKNSNTNLVQNMVTSAESIEELEAKFERVMKEKKGFIIKPMKEDGACLFRAVADQIYGDEEMHSTIRVHCMDYIVILAVL